MFRHFANACGARFERYRLALHRTHARFVPERTCPLRTFRVSHRPVQALPWCSTYRCDDLSVWHLRGCRVASPRKDVVGLRKRACRTCGRRRGHWGLGRCVSSKTSDGRRHYDRLFSLRGRCCREHRVTKSNTPYSALECTSLRSCLSPSSQVLLAYHESNAY